VQFEPMFLLAEVMGPSVIDDARVSPAYTHLPGVRYSRPRSRRVRVGIKDEHVRGGRHRRGKSPTGRQAVIHVERY